MYKTVADYWETSSTLYHIKRYVDFLINYLFLFVII